MMRYFLWIWGGILLSLPLQLLGQDSLEFSLRSPRSAVASHLYFLQENTYDSELAAQTLRGEEIPLEEREKLAIWLKQIYDGEGYYVEPLEIPDNPNYVDSVSGLSKWVVFDKYPNLYVSKAGDEWQYSARTVSEIPDIHRDIFLLGTKWLLQITPRISQRRALGLKVWQWQGILLLVLVAFVLFFLLGRLLHWVIHRIIPMVFPNGLLDRQMVSDVARPFSFLMVSIFLNETLPSLLLPVEVFQIISLALKVCIAVFGVVTMLRLIDLVASVSGSLASRTETAMDDQLIPLVRKIIKSVVITLGVLFVLQNFNVNITALLAGVSIGGLALALAAQDTVKNFIGSITIFVDRPFQIGDYIVTSSVSGSVVEVGIRSTRLQAIDGATISIPNGELANMAVTNHGVRTYRRYDATLGVSYDTPPDVLEVFVEKVREIVVSHPGTRNEGHNIYFHEMGDFALKISFQIYFEFTGYSEMLAARQDLFLALLREAEQMGVSFAFPSTSIYVEKLPVDPFSIPNSNA